MSDPLRHEPTRAHEPVSEADREAKIEQLLLAGLDHYFTGQYDQAINVWTRALFLDRSHARARAYIDRARTALAERQRLAEEMLETSRELLEQGQTDAARHLLSEAVAKSGEDERALVIRAKLERLEQLARTHTVPATQRPQTGPASTVVPGWQWPRRSRLLVSLSVATVVALALIFAVANPAV